VAKGSTGELRVPDACRVEEPVKFLKQITAANYAYAA